MSQVLNQKVCESKNDALIHDAHRVLDVMNKTISLTKGTAGTLVRGQVLDFDAEKGTYKVHATGGTASGIVATDTSYGEEDEKVVAPVYISGDFRASACVSAVELTETDKENLRMKDIVLK